MSASGRYSNINKRDLVDPSVMPASTIDARDIKIFRDSKYAGPAIEKVNPKDPKDPRRGLVGQVLLETQNGDAHSVTAAQFSLATFEKYNHRDLAKIKQALYRAHESHRRPPSEAALANAHTPVTGTTVKAEAGSNARTPIDQTVKTAAAKTSDSFFHSMNKLQTPS